MPLTQEQIEEARRQLAQEGFRVLPPKNKKGLYVVRNKKGDKYQYHLLQEVAHGNKVHARYKGWEIAELGELKWELAQTVTPRARAPKAPAGAHGGF